DLPCRDAGREAAIVGEPLQQPPGGGEAVFVGRIEMRVVERLDQLGERDRVGLGASDDPGHVTRPVVWRRAPAAPAGRARDGRRGAGRDGDWSRASASGGAGRHASRGRASSTYRAIANYK